MAIPTTATAPSPGGAKVKIAASRHSRHGKDTHTAKAAIMGARRIFGNFHSVKMVAHTGVAAANLGGGATTIDSLFRTAGPDRTEDLSSEELDSLVQEFQHTELLVIEEISMVGAAQFEMISRRLEQVAKALAGAHVWPAAGGQPRRFRRF